MATSVIASVNKITLHSQTYDNAVVVFLLTAAESGQFSGPNPYMFPVSQAQTLEDGTVIPACAPFVAAGEPSDAELYANIMVIARCWLSQLGFAAAEGDVDLVVESSGALRIVDPTTSPPAPVVVEPPVVAEPAVADPTVAAAEGGV